MANIDMLEKRRAELDERLSTLRLAPEVAEQIRKAANAARDHKNEALELEREIAKIDAEIGVSEMDKRAEAARKHRERVAAQQQEYVAEDDAYLQDVEDAEKALRAYWEKVNSILARNKRRAQLAQELSPSGKIPLELGSNDLVMRMSGRLAGLMNTIEGHRGRFGPCAK